jgi:hypothetical protein
MQCEYCGGSVEWQGPLSNLTHTKCLRCGGINCQVVENAPLDDEEEIDNSTQQTNGAEPTEISADIMEEHMKGCF